MRYYTKMRFHQRASSLMLAAIVLGRVLPAGADTPRNASVDFDKGYQSLKFGDLEGALRSFRYAARAGDPRAQFALGTLYLDGQGVERDARTGAKWVKRAASGGLLRAQSKIGALYLEGHGVDRSEKQAARWFKKAAECNDAGAQLELGKLYISGHGVKADPVEGYFWIALAAEQGEPVAAAARKELEEKLGENTTAAQRERVADWEPRAPRWPPRFDERRAYSTTPDVGRGVGSRDW